MTMVAEVTGLRKSYGKVRAVDDLTLGVSAGRVVGLVGPNGAGKTTTISCMTGLLEPDAGDVRILGRPVADRNVRQAVGLATQEIALYPGLSVGKNLLLFAKLGGVSDPAGAVEETANRMAIGHLLDRPVRNLSVGQQRLCHVAAALVHDPKLVLLDEPTAGLDIEAREVVLRAVRQLASEARGLVFSSHYLAEVEEVCDDVVIVVEGKVVAEGPVADLVAAHGDPYVEVRGKGGELRHPGQDVAAALAAWGKKPVESVNVVRPSLEAVFVRLAGHARSEMVS